MDLKLIPSSWVVSASNSSTVSDAGSDYFAKDVFNLTLSPGNTEPPYNLTGTIKDADYMISGFDMDLKACNTSTESSQNLMMLVDRDFTNNAGWNWTYPEVNIQFDGQTANFTLIGYAAGFPYLLASDDPLPPLGPTKDEVQGKIKVSFYGVIDPYHSDTLVNTSTAPTWLRTVGFGNNSMNIGCNSGTMKVPRPVRWAAVAFCFFISLAVMYF
ncbi:hypothetical protein N7461_006576 [Penicillium sp. DV-2018c]|nr:hypothetical protein N7461_006576 [Penicillium sp. DV-2018c]